MTDALLPLLVVQRLVEAATKCERASTDKRTYYVQLDIYGATIGAVQHTNGGAYRAGKTVTYQEIKLAHVNVLNRMLGSVKQMMDRQGLEP